MRSLLGVSLLVALVACVGPEDNPSNVHDLRVLAVQLDPPELLAQSTELTPANLLPLAQPLAYRALIVDPDGGMRSLDYKLWGCTDVADRNCDADGGQVELDAGQTTEGELALTISPAFATLPDGGPLLAGVLAEDVYGGAGGLRVPLVLDLKGGEEEIFAQKLMVYSFPFVPGMTANVNPELPGVTVNDTVVEEGITAELNGAGPFAFEPLPFEDRQEAYVVVGLANPPEPIHLTESWKIAWYTDYGIFSPNQTGGTDLGGAVSRHHTEWKPPSRAVERDVRFWFVVRDGRGGISWITRTARYRP